MLQIVGRCADRLAVDRDGRHQRRVRAWHDTFTAMVPAPRVKEIIANLIAIMQRHVPEDRLPEVARELRLLAPNAAPTGDAAE